MRPTKHNFLLLYKGFTEGNSTTIALSQKELKRIWTMEVKFVFYYYCKAFDNYLSSRTHSVVLVGAQSINIPLLTVSGALERVSILVPLDLFLVYINGDTHALDHQKYLGLNFSTNFSWCHHVGLLRKKTRKVGTLYRNIYQFSTSQITLCH